MNIHLSNYTFDEISIGQKIDFTCTITEELLDKFAEISGDYNPLHMDKNFAENTKFKRRICHGMLLASFFSKLVGMHLPGKNSLYFSQSLNFISPCFLGDEIIVKGEIMAKSNSTRIVTVKTLIERHDQILVRGEAKVLLMK